MTNPKTSESRAVASRTKPADGSAPPVPSDTNQDVVLQQLVSLAQSINALVRQNAEEPAPTPSRSAEELRVVFAYDFLGEVLGRRAPRTFKLRRVDVDRGFNGLTFTGLDGATAAKIRSDRNVVVELTDLRDGAEFSIKPRITDDQRIDSIVILSAPGGVPVAIGPCLGPVPAGLTDSKR